MKTVQSVVALSLLLPGCPELPTEPAGGAQAGGAAAGGEAGSGPTNGGAGGGLGGAGGEGGLGGDGGGMVCEPSATEACAYSGPAGTEGIGVCTAGERTCNADGSMFGPCLGEQLPSVELCSTATTDENCDGNSACQGDCAWSRRFGSVGNQYGQSVDATAQAIFVTGYFEGEIDFGTGALVSQGASDAYVAKLDLGGQAAWARRFGDAAAQFGYGVAAAPDGGVVVAGEFAGTLDFGCGAALVSAGGTDVFVAKLDADGECVWANRFGDAAAQAAWNVAVDQGDGSIGLTGPLQGQLDFGGAPLVAAGASQDVYFAKLTATGTHVWSRRFGDATNSQQGIDVAFDSTGALVAGGRFYGQVEFVSGTPLVASGQSAFLVKFGPAGATLWASSFGAEAAVGSVAIAPGDEVVVSGYFSNTLGLGGATSSLISAGVIDGFVAKFSSAGSALWSRRIGGAGEDRADALAVDEAGNVVAGGYFMSPTIDVLGASTLTNAGGWDAFFVKLDASGGFLWSQRTGGPGQQYCSTLATLPGDGSIVATSYFDGTLGGACTPVSSAGGFDAFVQRFQP